MTGVQTCALPIYVMMHYRKLYGLALVCREVKAVFSPLRGCGVVAAELLKVAAVNGNVDAENFLGILGVLCLCAEGEEVALAKLRFGCYEPIVGTDGLTAYVRIGGNGAVSAMGVVICRAVGYAPAITVAVGVLEAPAFGQTCCLKALAPNDIVFAKVMCG